MHRWTQKALVDTLMRGIKFQITDGIRIFKPKTLNDAISFARMNEKQLNHQQRNIKFSPFSRDQIDSTSPAKTTPPTINHLTRDNIK